MAATGKAATVGINEQYNYDIVRKFTIMTLIWGAIGMFVGVYIASELAFPILNFDNPYITFGRLRPVHTGAVIFGFGGSALFATSYYVVQRTSQARLFSDGLANFTFWGWQTQHLTAPRSLVPQSVMPNYPWLATTDLDYSDIGLRLRALRKTGVPYSESQAEYERNVQEFGADVAKYLHIPDAEKNLIEQAQQGNYDTNPAKLSEMDALVAYLQMLGTLVDFKKYDDDYFVKFR